MKYSVNLIQDILRQEDLEAARKARMVTLFTVSFSLLALSLFYLTVQVLTMKNRIALEQEKLQKIEEEYQKYQKTSMIVNRSDIELLDKLQRERIYWTKKLVSSAKYLPADYWVEQINYDSKYTIAGFGYTVPEQKQLLTLDTYLNSLRADSAYNDVFTASFLNSVVRTDEAGVKRVHFELTSQQGAGR